jgi:signal transduction histidine kinase
MKRYSFHILAGALIVTTILLMWFGYRAASEWRRSTRLFVERRTVNAIYLMMTALNRDMRGVQSQVLPQLDSLSTDSDAALGDEVAKAFARFPYPESFFSWQAGTGILSVFNRADRLPQWYHGDVDTTEFPATVLKTPPELQALVGLLREQASLRTRFILFETTFKGEPYQVVARPVYVPPSRTRLHSIVGFTVNINWVRTHYFRDLIAEVSRVIGRHSVALEVLDESGTLVAGNRPAPNLETDSDGPVRERKFPLLFFDPALRATAPPATLPVRNWTARVQIIRDESMLAATSGARRIFLLISLVAGAAVVALLLTVRAVRSASVLATMKSEFVSAVTHELKTPLSSIRLVSETLAKGRFRAPEKVAEYATLLLNDVSRLTRTVDNLLTMSRVQDIERFYTFESTDPGTLLEDALNSFDPYLKDQGFEVIIDIPAPLPAVMADRTAVGQVLENVLDNAIRYSNGRRHLSISASASDTCVSLKIEDKGQGIPADEVPHVFEKFFRGQGASAGGSGLGLAIAQRIMKDHHGDITLHSVVGAGTVAEITLPLAVGNDVYEETNSGRRGRYVPGARTV